MASEWIQINEIYFLAFASAITGSQCMRNKMLQMKNNTVAIVLILLVQLQDSFSQATDKRMIDDIRQHRSGTGVWWAGHNSWIIKSGDLVVTTDLYLENSLRLAPSPITPEEIASEVDISFVTHAHGDHFNEYTSRI